MSSLARASVTPRLQPRQRLEPEADAARRRRVQRHRQQDARIGTEEGERRGQDADHFGGPAVDRDALTDRILGAAEAALPVAVRQDDAQRLAGRIVVGAEGATDDGLHAEQRQRARADEKGLHAFRIAGAGDRDISRIPGANSLERALVLAIGQVSRRPVIRSGPVWRVLAEADERLWFGEGQGLQQYAVDNAEDRGRRADPQRERQDGGCGKGGLLPEDAHRVQQVL